MCESIRAMRDNLDVLLYDITICALHLLGKSAIGKEGSFAEANSHWESTDKDCAKCAYHDDCALMIMEE